MSKLTYQQRGSQSTRIPVSQRRTAVGKVLEDNRAAFAAKQLKQGGTAQRTKEEDELLKGESGTKQLAKKDEEETAQAKFYGQAPVQREEKATKPNNTGMPDQLKDGVEALSGLSMDNVKVHYNSAKPQQLNALAYAQGTDIHVGPGQEKHLPHEAWHVVQQAQGQVKPTMQMKEGMPVNNDAGLEHEADVMGQMAVTRTSKVIEQANGQEGTKPTETSPEIGNKAIVQNKLRFEGEEEDTKGKYVQSSEDVYEEIRHYVNLQFHDGYYNFGSEEHALAIGMLHGQLIKWANDETLRPTYTIAKAVQLAAEEREDFKNLVRETKNIQEDLDMLSRLEYLLKNFNYRDTQPADRILMVQLAAGNIATKTNKTVVLEKAQTLQHLFQVKINTGEAELKEEEDASGFLLSQQQIAPVIMDKSLEEQQPELMEIKEISDFKENQPELMMKEELVGEDEEIVIQPQYSSLAAMISAITQKQQPLKYKDPKNEALKVLQTIKQGYIFNPPPDSLVIEASKYTHQFLEANKEGIRIATSKGMSNKKQLEQNQIELMWEAVRALETIAGINFDRPSGIIEQSFDTTSFTDSQQVSHTVGFGGVTITGRTGSKHGENANTMSASLALTTIYKLKEKNAFVAGHLVTRKAAGKASDNNLTPTPGYFNQGSIRTPESQAEGAIRKDQVISYSARANYGRTSNDDSDVDFELEDLKMIPKSIFIKIVRMGLKDGGDGNEIGDWTKNDTTIYTGTVDIDLEQVKSDDF